MENILLYAGIVMSIAGTLILYYYGNLPFGDTDLTYIYSDEELLKKDLEEKQIKIHYKKMRITGLITTLLGIIISGIAAII